MLSEILCRQRSFPAKRWVSIGLRCFHLVGICGLAGGYLFGLPESEWFIYLLITLASGFLMILKEVYTDGIWLLQLRGQVIFFKLLLLGIGVVFLPEPDIRIFLVVVFISGVVAHAPGKLRYYSIWHGQVLTREMLTNPESEVKDCGES